jgi:hypothetical protein
MLQYLSNKVKVFILILLIPSVSIGQIQKQEETSNQELDAVKQFSKIMAVRTSTGEPTEDQMKLAILINIKAQRELLSSFSDIHLEEGDIVGLYFSLIGKANESIGIDVENFEKYSCVSASGKPGYVCDYVVKVTLQGRGMNKNVYNTMNKYSGSTISTARFSKVDGVWVIVEKL